MHIFEGWKCITETALEHLRSSSSIDTLLSHKYLGYYKVKPSSFISTWNVFTINRSGPWLAFVFFWKCEASSRAVPSCQGTFFLRWDIITPAIILLIVITLTSRQSAICPWYNWKCSSSIPKRYGHCDNQMDIFQTSLKSTAKEPVITLHWIAYMIPFGDR